MSEISVEWQINGIKHSQVISANTPVAIGRDPECDIVLADPYVSRQHATILFRNGNFHIQNESQTNPIVFNERWMIATDLQADLQPGDCFEVGKVRLWVGYPKPALNGKGKHP